MRARTLRVLHGPHKSGPCCVLCSYKGYSTLRCYCNPTNVVVGQLVHDEPIENTVSCPVCEAYRQRLAAFWADPTVFPVPTGSEGQHA